MTTIPKIPTFILTRLSTPVQANLFTVQIAALVVTIIVIAAFVLRFDDRPYPGLEIVGKEGKTTMGAKWHFLKAAPSIIYETAKKTLHPYQVIALGGPLIILPADSMEDLRKDERMTFKAFLEKMFFTHYPGFNGFRSVSDSDIMINSIKQGLTQSLVASIVNLDVETAKALQELFPATDEWRETCFDEMGVEIIARLSSRTFLPEPLCYNKQWLEIAAKYTLDFHMGAFSLRMVPPALRPIAYWFIPYTWKLRAQVRLARKLINPYIDARRAEQQKAMKEGRPPQKVSDALQWIDNAAKGENCDVVAALLGYTLAAVHTTSVTLVNCFYELLSHPEYINELREEVITVFKEEGAWTKPSLTKLRLMDSFMKESQRTSPVTLIPINRVAVENFTLPDGTKVPKGATLGLPVTKMKDGTVFENPEEFDGYRFYKMRQQPGNEQKWQFVSTSNEHVSFGHGKHACPGRFFASNEIKIILAHLLTKYEWKLKDGKRPKVVSIGTEFMTNPDSKILYRSRVSEI
ncbi:cytochrome P450 [Lepidopterella palustris CBS 459.81]|uniref:Cytochrome P450 n=1 Tax=Lepidopterella palustris CBS 459.81 TaxID=1314670 RepID=A0A8E2DWX1_9PEZI|nr:cytochrome P450 [Lepidopterella palustris CBS 459.81]